MAQKRLDSMLLPMMRRHGVSMWIVTTEEFHAEPLRNLSLRRFRMSVRDFFFFFYRGTDKLDRVAVVRYPEEHLGHFFEVLNPPRNEIAETLRRTVTERNPKTIALDMGGTRGATNGMTHDAYVYLSETLGKEYAGRFKSAAPLIVEYLDTRLPEELPLPDRGGPHRSPHAASLLKRGDHTWQLQRAKYGGGFFSRSITRVSMSGFSRTCASSARTRPTQDAAVSERRGGVGCN
jgi:hypothetical protein